MFIMKPLTQTFIFASMISNPTILTTPNHVNFKTKSPTYIDHKLFGL